MEFGVEGGYACRPPRRAQRTRRPGSRPRRMRQLDRPWSASCIPARYTARWERGEPPYRPDKGYLATSLRHWVRAPELRSGKRLEWDWVSRPSEAVHLCRCKFRYLRPICRQPELSVRTTVRSWSVARCRNARAISAGAVLALDIRMCVMRQILARLTYFAGRQIILGILAERIESA